MTGQRRLVFAFPGELETRTGELMTGTIKPAEFTAAMQKAADTVASDPDITKFTR